MLSILAESSRGTDCERPDYSLKPTAGRASPRLYAPAGRALGLCPKTTLEIRSIAIRHREPCPQQASSPVLSTRVRTARQSRWTTPGASPNIDCVHGH